MENKYRKGRSNRFFISPNQFITEANAQFTLGYMYEAGEGVNKDLEKAVYWYQQSANQGHIKAQKSLDRILKK